jgi:hypothetical protein
VVETEAARPSIVTVAGSFTVPATCNTPPPACVCSLFSASYVQAVTPSSICSDDRWH